VLDHLRRSEYPDRITLKTSSAIELLQAAAYLLAQMRAFERYSLCQPQPTPTPTPPYPHGTVSQCQPENYPVARSLPPSAQFMPQDSSPWAAVHRAAHIAQRARGRASALQKQLQQMCCHHLALQAALEDVWLPTDGGLVRASPYELAVLGRKRILSAHLETLEALTGSCSDRQRVSKHGAEFFRWVSEIASKHLDDSRDSDSTRQCIPEGAVLRGSGICASASVLRCSTSELADVRSTAVCLCNCYARTIVCCLHWASCLDRGTHEMV
jgi:hypothetical protein